MAETLVKNKKKSIVKNFFKTFSTKNLIWFFIGSILNLGGFAFIVTSVVGDCLNVAPSKNPILLANAALKSFTHTPLGFNAWGIILLLLGAVIVAIVLSVASQNEDRERERQARRDQRLKQMADIEKEDAVIQTSTIINSADTNSSFTKK
jgi:hypothetical protein